MKVTVSQEDEVRWIVQVNRFSRLQKTPDCCRIAVYAERNHVTKYPILLTPVLLEMVQSSSRQVRHSVFSQA